MANDPGWYSDPWRPGRRRWWDGSSWTDHTWDPHAPAAPAVPPAPSMPPMPQAPAPTTWWAMPDPRRDLDDERRASTWARRAFTALFLWRITSGVVTVAVINSVIDDIQRAIDTNGSAQPSSGGWQVLNTPLSIVGFAAFIGVLLWVHKAATVARNLNYPARRTPGWAIAGWFIPIVNFWFPYQSMRDCLAPGNGERGTVLRWWLLYLAGAFVWILAIAAAALFSVAIGLAVALPCGLINAVELQTALRMVDAVDADHADAIRRIVTR